MKKEEKQQMKKNTYFFNDKFGLNYANLQCFQKKMFVRCITYKVWKSIVLKD